MRLFILSLFVFVTGCAAGTLSEPPMLPPPLDDPQAFCERARYHWRQNSDAEPRYRVHGHVANGGGFKEELSSQFIFRIQKHPLGWQVNINSPADEKPDFGFVVSPPYSGPNPRIIFSKLVYDGRPIIEKGHTRSFCFVASAHDYLAARQASRLVMAPFEGGPTLDEQDQAHQRALTTLNALTLGVVRFKVTEGHVSKDRVMSDFDFEADLFVP